MIRISLDSRGPDWHSLRWFSLAPPAIWIRGVGRRTLLVWLWTCFHRHMVGGGCAWGVGLLNISGRHLLYVGHEQADALFVRVWRR